MRLYRVYPPLPAIAAPVDPPGADDGVQPAVLDPRTRTALIKLLGRAIDVVGEAEARALAPALVGCLSSPAHESGRLCIRPRLTPRSRALPG